jgi:hypothetical protein
MNRALAQLIVEAVTWRPGNKVPKGYLVVFDELVRQDDERPSNNPLCRKAFEASTKAWIASADLERYHSELSDIIEASELHQEAAEAHRVAAKHPSMKYPLQPRDLANKHAKAYLLHRKWMTELDNTIESMQQEKSKD